MLLLLVLYQANLLSVIQSVKLNYVYSCMAKSSLHIMTKGYYSLKILHTLAFFVCKIIAAALRVDKC